MNLCFIEVGSIERSGDAQDLRVRNATEFLGAYVNAAKKQIRGENGSLLGYMKRNYIPSNLCTFDSVLYAMQLF